MHRNIMRGRARGQTVLEFGLIAMLFMLLLFGIFDFGFLLNDWISITAGASVGARQAAVGACLQPVCPTGETSVVEAVMTSPAVLSVSPVAADIALIDADVPAAYCRRAVRSTDGTLSVTPITSGWNPEGIPCSGGSPSPRLNSTITVQVRARVDIPAPFLGLPSQMDIPSSSTVRYEGAYLP